MLRLRPVRADNLSVYGRTLVVALALTAAACGGGAMTSPTAPSASSSTTTTPTTPAPAATPFTIALPLRAQDRANAAFGLNSFGIHIGDHGIDGHPGWDIEYAIGSNVLAAADGTIQSVIRNSDGFGIQVTHRVAGRDAYRTVYGVASVASGITAGASVTAGQPLGVVASYTRTIGTITVTYAFIHFQLDDFSSNAGQTNQNAVNPEPFLNTEARQLFQSIWRDAFYTQELVEPFVGNPRDVTFPMTRTWRLQSGSLAPRIDVTRLNAFASTFTYTMRDSAGMSIETGTIELELLARPSAIDFIPDGSSQRRRGVYSIVDDAMQLNYGAPGATRPSSLSGAATYTTTR